jgi:predicted MFS family arabinose efflux permease
VTLLASRRGLLAFAVAIAVALAFADSSIVVLALPDLYGELDASIEGIALVITAYNVVVAVLSLAIAPFVRRLPAVLLTRVGLAVFLAAGVGCALADSLEVLVACRGVQGLGGAMLLIGSLPLLGALTGSGAKGATWWTAAGALGAAVGPALGGLLTQAFDWRAIFAVQAPLAALALLGTVGAHVRDVPAEPARRSEGPALAANAALGLVFGALVGALFLGVLMLVALWSLEPIAAAAVVTAVPVSTLVARPLARAVPPRTAVAGGAVLLAAGLGVLALLPSTSVAFAAGAMALCGVGLGLAVPVLSDAAVTPERGLARSGAWSVGARHLGLVLALVLVAPLLAVELDEGSEHAALAGASAILEAPVPLETKVPLALDLRDGLRKAQKGELPDLDAAFDERGAQTDERVAELRDTLLSSIQDALTRSFRTSYALSALLALLALVPAALMRPRRPAT